MIILIPKLFRKVPFNMFKKKKNYFIHIGLFIITQILAVTIQESYVLANLLLTPFTWIQNWQPDQNNKFLLLLRYDVILIFYILFIYAIWEIKNIFWGKQKTSRFYEDELAATLEAVYDNNRNRDQVKYQVKSLFDKIVNEIATDCGVSKNRYRAVVVHRDFQQNENKFSNLSWGNEISSQQEQYDRNALEVFLTNNGTIAYWTNVQEQFPNGDVKTYLFVRNLDAFRMGCLLAFSEDIPKSVLDKLKDKDTPMTLIGHVDKIFDVIVNY